MTKRRNIRVAKEAYLHAGEYAYAGRKNRKRDFRQLWITRISEATGQRGMAYNVFINKLKAANVELDRKTLAYLVTEEPDVFERIVDSVNVTN